LAELASIHRTHVGLLERGQRGASLDVAKALARALDEELSTLIAETEASL
jgi:transcriptional regulator with XRE-family HTH domain